ncbi:MAG: hypothetical protein WC461_02835 [Candidatus Paceibacterota bacterium]
MGKITETKRIIKKELARDFGKKKPVKIAKQVARSWDLASRMPRRRNVSGKRSK